jgi:predicted dehydrogenase
MSNKLNLAIIGAGKMAHEHVKVFQSFKKVSLTLVFSRKIENAKKIADQFLIKNYTNCLEDIVNFKLDGILICVSADSIFNVTKNLIKHKIPLLIEKPTGLSLKEAKILADLSIKYQTPNIIALNRRYYSNVMKVISILKKEQYKGFLIEGHELTSRLKALKIKNKILNKWIYSNSIHTINLILFFGLTNKFTYKFMKNNSNLDKNFSSVFKFENKIIGTYIANWSSSEKWSIKLFLKNLTIQFKPLENVTLINLKSKKIIPLSAYDKKYKPGLYNQALNFIKLIKDKKNHWPDENLNTIVKTYQVINKLN